MEDWVVECADGAWEMVAPVAVETAEAAVAQREEKEEGEGEDHGQCWCAASCAHHVRHSRAEAAQRPEASARMCTGCGRVADISRERSLTLAPSAPILVYSGQYVDEAAPAAPTRIATHVREQNFLPRKL